MGRTILDGELRSWEAFATTGPYGFPDPARVVFRCLSDSGQRARAVTLEGDKSEAERLVGERTEAELREMLRDAPELG